MIKLTQILKEIKVSSIPQFRDDDELFDYLTNNPNGPKLKNKLIDALIASGPIYGGNNANIIAKWRKAPIERHTHVNVDDELMLDDGEDNRVYFSLNFIDESPIRKIELEDNTFYFWVY